MRLSSCRKAGTSRALRHPETQGNRSRSILLLPRGLQKRDIATPYRLICEGPSSPRLRSRKELEQQKACEQVSFYGSACISQIDPQRRWHWSCRSTRQTAPGWRSSDCSPRRGLGLGAGLKRGLASRACLALQERSRGAADRVLVSMQLQRPTIQFCCICAIKARLAALGARIEQPCPWGSTIRSELSASQLLMCLSGVFASVESPCPFSS